MKTLNKKLFATTTQFSFKDFASERYNLYELIFFIKVRGWPYK
jgi:hypothetical protein